MSATIQLNCPECEYEFRSEPLNAGETLICPECQLSLQAVSVGPDGPTLRTIEMTLDDWGQ
jgi:uncharacterized paraquat-inducible protein A